MLRKRLNMRELRNTDLIQISVLDQERNQAAEITNAIAEEISAPPNFRTAGVVKSVAHSAAGRSRQTARRKVEELRRPPRESVSSMPSTIESREPRIRCKPGEGSPPEEEQVNNERLKVTALRAKQPSRR
jgi:hypothetical protein